jgi:hypothetical protein
LKNPKTPSFLKSSGYFIIKLYCNG